MERREIVRRAIEFGKPPRLPFFQTHVDYVPSDVCYCWEMDRARRGWFFDRATEDDWGCRWASTDLKNMGQVTFHPLEDWSSLSTYRPPNPRDPFYFDRVEDALAGAEDRYRVVSSHFNLIERLHLLRGFTRTFEDIYLHPAETEQLLDMILEFKIGLLHELNRRFGDRVDGIFLTDDWGTQSGTFVSPAIFARFFLPRYRQLFRAIHDHGWHAILHSCGKINDFLPPLIDAGLDVINIHQPQACGIQEIGRRFSGHICFLETADVQKTLPVGDPEQIRAEVRCLVEELSTPEGGFIVYTCRFPEAVGADEKAVETMYRAFADLMYHRN